MPDQIARGANFVFTKEYIEKTHGAALFAELVAKLSPEAKELWSQRLLVSSSYSFVSFKEMTKALGDAKGDGTFAETARLYAFIADRSLNSLYKMFFKMTQPAFVIKNYPVLWMRFFNAGTVTVASVGKGGGRLVFRLPEVFSDWIEPACYGYSKKAVAMAGGSGLEQKIVSRVEKGAGEFEITFDITWIEKGG